MRPQAIDRLEARVSDLMTRHPIVVRASDRAGTAADLLRNCRIRHLPVVDEGGVVGVVSVRDLLTAVGGAMRVRELMSAPVETTTSHVAAEAAAERLLRRHVSCLPVVEAGRLIAILTATDLLRFAAVALEDEAAQLQQAPAVTQLMTFRPIHSVAPEATLAAAWQLMKEQRIRHLPVMRDGKVIGMLSDRDILATGGHLAIPVAEAMSARVAVVGAESRATEAAHLLLQRRLGALPVMRGGATVGVLTVADFLYWIISRA
jgi:CBS domain-containing protein